MRDISIFQIALHHAKYSALNYQLHALKIHYRAKYGLRWIQTDAAANGKKIWPTLLASLKRILFYNRAFHPKFSQNWYREKVWQVGTQKNHHLLFGFSI